MGSKEPTTVDAWKAQNPKLLLSRPLKAHSSTDDAHSTLFRHTGKSLVDQCLPNKECTAGVEPPQSTTITPEKVYTVLQLSLPHWFVNFMGMLFLLTLFSLFFSGQLVMSLICHEWQEFPWDYSCDTMRIPRFMMQSLLHIGALCMLCCIKHLQ